MNTMQTAKIQLRQKKTLKMNTMQTDTQKKTLRMNTM